LSTNFRVAVIGSGYWGRNLVRNFYELGALAAVCDRNLESLQEINKLYPDVAITTSMEQLLADEKIAAVAIATPAEMHYQMVCKALAAGKDVFVEKPLCSTADYREDLVQRAQAAKAILMVGHLLWYHPAVLKIKEMIDTGFLGRLQYIYSHRLNLGKIRREENILWSFAPHDISVILGLASELPSSVTAGGGNYLNPHIADVTVSQLAFPSGVRAHIFVSWLHPFKEQRLVVVGDRRMVVFNDTEPEDKLLVYPHSIEWHGVEAVPCKAKAEKIALPKVEPLKEELRHFLDCLASRQEPRTSGEEGLRVLSVLESCQQALMSEKKSQSREKKTARPYFVHPTAVVDDKVKIGVGTKIWHFCHLMDEAKIGSNCVLGQNVVVAPRVCIGSGCKIQNNVSIYAGVELEDDVFCGPSMVFTNVINPRAHISRKNEFRRTLVGKGATIGANATIICGNNIGRYAFVGAGAVVTCDVPDYALVTGNPARLVGWVCACGQRLEFNANGKCSCKACEQSYELQNEEVVVVVD